MTPGGPEARTSEGSKPSKTMLVAWALGECGGDREYVDKLDVAVYAFRAYSSYFGFQKYPDYPDVDAVRVQLTDLVKIKHSRPFGLDCDVPLASQTRDGQVTKWRLTEDGATWWLTNRERLRLWVERNEASELGTTKTSRGVVKTEDDAKRALVNRVRGTDGFARWIRDPSASRREIGLQTFLTSFGIGPRTPRPAYIDARDRVLEATSSDAEVTRFLKLLDQAFGEDYKKILRGEVQI
jgi:hypothetical protein